MSVNNSNIFIKYFSLSFIKKFVINYNKAVFPKIRGGLLLEEIQMLFIVYWLSYHKWMDYPHFVSMSFKNVNYFPLKK